MKALVETGAPGSKEREREMGIGTMLLVSTELGELGFDSTCIILQRRTIAEFDEQTMRAGGNEQKRTKAGSKIWALVPVLDTMQLLKHPPFVVVVATETLFVFQFVCGFIPACTCAILLYPQSSSHADYQAIIGLSTPGAAVLNRISAAGFASECAQRDALPRVLYHLAYQNSRRSTKETHSKNEHSEYSRMAYRCL